MLELFIGVVLGFCFGVLFGRANKSKVEKAVTEAKAQIEELKKKVNE